MRIKNLTEDVDIIIDQYDFNLVRLNYDRRYPVTILEFNPIMQ